MSPEHEKLIRETWSSVRGWPASGEYLDVPIRHRVLPLYAPGELMDLNPVQDRLTFERGIEYSNCGLWKRMFIECEGLRLEEYVEPIKATK